MSTYIHGLTLTSIKDIEKVHALYLQKHNASIRTVDASIEPQVVVLSAEEWVQGVVSKIVLYNSAGADLIVLDGTHLSAIELKQNGDAALFTVVKTGNGTSPVYIEQTEILASGTRYGVCLIQRLDDNIVIQKVHNS